MEGYIIFDKLKIIDLNVEETAIWKLFQHSFVVQDHNHVLKSLWWSWDHVIARCIILHMKLVELDGLVLLCIFE